MRSYEPLLASPEHAPLIRELVGWFGPKDRAAAKTAAAAVSGLVWWAEQTGRPVDPDALLVPDVVDAYAAQATALAENTRENQRSALRRIIRRRPGPNARRQPKARPRVDPRLAYTPAEVDALLVWASGQPSAKRRHALLAILGLGLGAGLSAGDMRHVTGTDVTTDPATGTVAVTVRRDGQERAVPVLARYEELVAGLARAAGGLWILNPDVPLPRDSGDPQAVKRQIVPAQPAADAPPLLAARCRNTWLLHHLAAGTRFDALMQAAGYTDGGRSIARLLPALAPDPAADAARMLRDATPHGQRRPAPGPARMDP